MKPTDYLRSWLEREPAPWRLGQVLIRPGFTLSHGEDHDVTRLTPVRSLAALREIIKYDITGAFRPLRASPNLRRGWKMENLSFPGLVEALQTIYPAAVANWAGQQQGELMVTEYQETAERQTGRFQIIRTLGEERLHEIVVENCAVACAKIRLWQPSSKLGTRDSELPLLCPEACNYLLGKAREKIKGPGAED